MSQESRCSNCTDSNDCKQAYEQLGNAKGPSVATKAIIAFILPVVVFILALLAFEKVFTGAFHSEKTLGITTFICSMTLTIVYIFIVRIFTRRSTIKKSCDSLEGAE